MSGNEITVFFLFRIASHIKQHTFRDSPFHARCTRDGDMRPHQEVKRLVSPRDPKQFANTKT